MIYEPKESSIQLPSLWLPDSRRRPLSYPSSSRGLPGYPCCCTPPIVLCEQFEDGFLRSDSSDLGPDWSEEVGDWEILSSRLFTSDANSVCVSTVDLTLPYLLETSADFSFNEFGDEHRLIFNYVDTDNYDFIEGSVNTIFRTRYRIITRVGGVETLLKEIEADGSIGMTLCVYSTYVVLTVTNGSMGVEMPVTSAVAGVGTGLVPNDVSFSVFRVSTFEDDDPECSAVCDDTCNCSKNTTVRKTTDLEVVITGIMNETPADCTDCVDLNDTYITPLDFCSILGNDVVTFTFLLDGTVCDATAIQVRIREQAGGTFDLTVDLETDLAGNRRLSFELEDIGDDFDCEGMIDLDIPWDGVDRFNGICSVSTPTCTITSLPGPP